MHKCVMKIKKIIYPKTKIESGDFAIISTSLVKVIAGEKPILDKEFGTVTLKGNVPAIKLDEEYTFTFNNPSENRYGTSYFITNVTKEVNLLDKKEVLGFLEIVSGEKTAKELIKIENIYEKLMTRQSEELLKVKGIGEKRLESIYKKFDDLSDNSEAYSKLLPKGLTKERITNLCKVIKNPHLVVDLCFNNPYKLIDKVKGMGFIAADEIAEKCGYGDKAKRVKYGIMHVLNTEAEEGRTYLTSNQLMTKICEISKVDMDYVTPIIEELAKEGKLVLNETGTIISSKKYLDLEKSISLRIKDLMNSDTRIRSPRKWREIIQKMEEEQGWKHDEIQMQGIEKCLKNNVIVITGLAGTGKSTISNAVCEIFKDKDITMCCLSAKAAQRLNEVTGYPTSTIHKLLGIGKDYGDRKTKKINTDILIIDEASMINGTLFEKLLYSIDNGTKVLILGDTGQLTAIGNCNVFADIINSGIVPTVQLKTVHRQGKTSAINSKAIDIRHQKRIFDYSFIGTIAYGEKQDLIAHVLEKEDMLELIKEKFSQRLLDVNDVREVQVITPMKNRGEISTKTINLAIQEMYTDTSKKYFLGKEGVKIYKGDKVINTKNNYKSKDESDNITPIFNGSIGIVKKITEKEVLIDFIGIGVVVVKDVNFDNIDLAYAITVHSSQGSQWRSTIVAIDILSYKLLNVELVYTAITRAIENCDFIIQPSAMNMAIRTVENKNKQTLLKNYLLE